jgi:hypothetical protein
MRKYMILFLVIQLFPVNTAKSQAPVHDTSAQLQDLFSRLANSTEDTDRLRINDSICSIVDSYVRSDSIFDHKFRNIRYLGEICPRNSKVKIVTWNLILRNSKSRYYCYFINRTGKQNSVYSLVGTYREDTPRTDTIYSRSDWYGALYYDIRPLKKDNKLYWMLLGVDYGNPSVTRKIIDVLSFIGNGDIILGRKWFSDSADDKFRVVIEYSSDAVISMKFLSDKSIVFDHLVPFSAKQAESRSQYGPEYSYDGYNYEKGVWKFKPDVEVRNKK